uniref:Chromate transporter n=1 Tax=Polynucleobacter necessarius subsp. necessarius (strain STIR1) TaxID=452638 RepID=B1XVS2_POLNS
MTVTLIGWNVGGIIGALVATLAITWPSSIMIYFLQRSILGMHDIQKQKIIQAAAGVLAVGLVLSVGYRTSN